MMKWAVKIILACMIAVMLAAPVFAATIVSGPISVKEDTSFYKNATNRTFTDIRVGSADLAYDYSGGTITFGLSGSKDTDLYKYSRLYGVIFDKHASLLPNDTITSAALCLRAGATGESTGLGSLNLAMVGLDTANDTGLTVGDYDNYVSEPQYAPNLTPAAWGTSRFNCFNLSAAGIANISKTGPSRFMVGLDNVFKNSTNGITFTAEATSGYPFYPDPSGGTTSHPYLEYTWETYVAPGGNASVAGFTPSKLTTGRGGPITFTDTSTETPTTWYWEFGDGNTSTTQSPTFIYNVPGTYEVHFWANNTVGGSWKNDTSIVVYTWPASYMNPRANMVPWYDQGSVGICSGTASASALNLMRLEELDVTPTSDRPAVSRNVWFNWSTNTVKSDVHTDYAISPISMYAKIYELNSTIESIDVANVMLTGGNLASDQITSKTSTTEYEYPQSAAYLDSHRYNGIGNYERYVSDNSTTRWNLIKQKISEAHVAILLIDTYSNLHSTPSEVLLPEPTGAPVIGHYVAAVGYNDTLEQIYFENSWGEDQTAIGGITKTYWQYGRGTKSSFIIPYNITVDESLVPMGVTNLTNQTPGCSSVNISWTNPAHTDFNDTIIRANNVIKTRASNTTTFFNITGISGTTIISTNTCDFWNCNTTFVNTTVTTPDCTPPESISNLANTTTCNSVNITYDSPPDMDFNKTIWRQDNVIKSEPGNTTTSINFTGLSESTTYAFSGQSCDLAGNCNTTVFGNMSAATGACSAPPVAQFSANNVSSCIGVPVQFTDLSTNTPTSWNWTFGDGNVSALKNPSHTYNVLGQMTVNLTANNTYGLDFERKVNYITVSNCSSTPSSSSSPISAEGVFGGIASGLGLIVVVLAVIAAATLIIVIKRISEGDAEFDIVNGITLFVTAVILIVAAVFIFAALYSAVSV